ncbi:hypothetical protein WJX73_010429 [Symbiochloris irregularis]|uniref:Uncharacterized protein n=1 Tax=Symbiochloris irregularis TaxID=706552 RepID=A0AAW1PC23_9CHLO
MAFKKLRAKGQSIRTALCQFELLRQLGLRWLVPAWRLLARPFRGASWLEACDPLFGVNCPITALPAVIEPALRKSPQQRKPRTSRSSQQSKSGNPLTTACLRAMEAWGVLEYGEYLGVNDVKDPEPLNAGTAVKAGRKQRWKHLLRLRDAQEASGLPPGKLQQMVLEVKGDLMLAMEVLNLMGSGGKGDHSPPAAAQPAGASATPPGSTQAPANLHKPTPTEKHGFASKVCVGSLYASLDLHHLKQLAGPMPPLTQPDDDMVVIDCEPGGSKNNARLAALNGGGKLLCAMELHRLDAEGALDGPRGAPMLMGKWSACGRAPEHLTRLDDAKAELARITEGKLVLFHNRVQEMHFMDLGSVIPPHLMRDTAKLLEEYWEIDVALGMDRP